MIQGELVDIVAYRPEYIDLAVEMLSDPEVRRYLPSFIWPPGASEVRDWFQRMEGDPRTRNFAILDKSGQFIGNIGLRNLNWQSRTVDLVIFIGDRRFWGNGYGRDAICAVLDHLFANLNLHRVGLQVLEYNERAIRCYQACGFVVEGRSRQAHYANGRYWDLIQMGILKDEWYARRDMA